MRWPITLKVVVRKPHAVGADQKEMATRPNGARIVTRTRPARDRIVDAAYTSGRQRAGKLMHPCDPESRRGLCTKRREILHGAEGAVLVTLGRRLQRGCGGSASPEGGVLSPQRASDPHRGERGRRGLRDGQGQQALCGRRRCERRPGRELQTAASAFYGGSILGWGLEGDARRVRKRVPAAWAQGCQAKLTRRSSTNSGPDPVAR